MDLHTAKQIIEALADGVDPRTGEVLPPGSPIDSTDVVRALHVALSAIDRQMRRLERESALPVNAGKPWCDRDDRELSELFDAGQPVTEIARAFQRTPGSIASRLVRLGKVRDRHSAFVASLNQAANVSRA